ncbi:MAG: hypothetical protein OEZ68_05590 [Gammaproteobacteria bacterium]|nr:hypothetical protein [Gammaproteobacteria bacterium]MDH5800261.1 hypothetical protein [Gammaproteobacteria bacterium]
MCNPLGNKTRHSLLLVILLFTHSAATVADPTRPLYSKGAKQKRAAIPAPITPASRFDLSAVLVSGQRTVAVVNGQILLPGDRVDGAVVAKIDPGSVTLEHNGRTLVLRLREDGVSGYIDIKR